jgi:hypothetical protein
MRMTRHQELTMAAHAARKSKSLVARSYGRDAMVYLKADCCRPTWRRVDVYEDHDSSQ